MAAYVMSDIHGCYDELMQMLKKIGFSLEDTLFIAGDYMDRGNQSLEMLNWILDAPKNVILLKGNHDVEFSSYVDSMDCLKRILDYEVSDDSIEDTIGLYNLANQSGLRPFDYYGTIDELINKHGATLGKLKEWKQAIDNMKTVQGFRTGEKRYFIVHAGFIEINRISNTNLTVEQFRLYARDQAYTIGGKRGWTIIAGHTPTISHHHMMYTGGRIFKHYNEELDCTYYDIDCGCVYREALGEGNLACIRLEDEKEFYLYD